MKYYNLTGSFDKKLISHNSFKKALKRIGELNPYDIKRATLKVNHTTNTTSGHLTKKQLYNRGVLSVRRKLNGHLGKSGKYTNRMIKKTAEIRTIDKKTYSTKLPKYDYLKIAKATYFLLQQYDEKYCQALFKDADNDNINIECPYLKTTAPIQTEIVKRSVGRKKADAKFENFVTYVQEEAGRK